MNHQLHTNIVIKFTKTLAYNLFGQIRIKNKLENSMPWKMVLKSLQYFLKALIAVNYVNC